MGKTKWFACFVHDCIKRKQCKRYYPPELDALCLTYSSKHFRVTEDDYSCFIQKCEEVKK